MIDFKAIFKKIFNAKSIIFPAFVIAVIFSGNMSSNAQNLNYDEAIGFIKTYSDAGQYLGDDLNAAVTREQFVNIVVSIFGKDFSAAEVSFDDIETGSVLYNNAAVAVQMGWIADSASFRPGDAVTLDEATKICCNIAGYGVYAKVSGGYPVGYMKAAQRAKITKNIASGGVMNSENVVQIIWNTLNADYLEESVYSSGGISFDASNESVMEKLLDIHKAAGILNANEYSSLNNKNDTGEKNRIEIDGVRYTNGNKKLNEYIGCRVNGYYISANGSSEKTLGYVFPKGNKILSLNAGEANFAYDKAVIEYGTNEIKTARINPVHDFIYNDCACFDLTLKKIPRQGTVTLIDNDEDGLYDVINITEYKYIEVNSFNKISMTISDKYDSNKIVDLEKADDNYIYTDTSGNELDIVSIKKGDIVAVAAPKDSRTVKIILCDKAVSGTIDYIDSSNMKISVSGNEYGLSPQFEDDIQSDTLKLKFGKEYQMVIGLNNEIVSIKMSEENWKYGYLIDAAFSDTLSRKLEIKLFSEDGEHIIFKIKDKIKVDGERLDSEETYNKLVYGGSVKPCLIKYFVNDEKELTAIALPTIETALPVGYMNEADKIKEYDFNTNRFYFRQHHFYPYFNDFGSIIFKVPQTDTKNEDLYEVGYELVDNTTIDSIYPYDVNKSGNAGAIVLKSDDASSVNKNDATKLMIVESVRCTIGADGADTKQITGWCDGAFVKMMLDSELKSTDDIVSGNVIRINASNNLIRAYETDFIAESLSPTSKSNSIFNMEKTASYAYVGGKIYVAGDGYVYLTNTKNQGVYDTALANLINIKLPKMEACVVYDMSEKKLRPADESYLKSILTDGDSGAAYLLVRSNYLNNRYGVIYIQ